MSPHGHRQEELTYNTLRLHEDIMIRRGRAGVTHSEMGRAGLFLQGRPVTHTSDVFLITVQVRAAQLESIIGC